jgi:hypothetical protein
MMGRKESVSRFENALDTEFPDASQIAEVFLQVYYAYIGSSLLINPVIKICMHKESSRIYEGR